MNRESRNGIYTNQVCIVGIVLIVLCMVVTESTFASEPVAGEIVYLQGEVSAADKIGVERKLSAKSPVFSGDLIQTSADGRLQISFKDGTVVSLIPHTKFLIEEYSYGGIRDTEKGIFSLIKGGLRTLSGLLRKDRFRVKTLTANIELDGTWFTAEMLDDAQLVVRVGFDPQNPTGVKIANNAGRVVIGRGQAAIVSGSGSLPQIISDREARKISQVSSADNILSVVSAANTLSTTNKDTLPGKTVVPPVIVPGDEAVNSSINSNTSGDNCGTTSRSCGTEVGLNVVLTKPLSATTVQTKLLTSAGIVEHFSSNGNAPDLDDISLYGQDIGASDIAYSTRPNRAETLLSNASADPKDNNYIANKVIGSNAFGATKGFGPYSGGAARTSIKEYQRVSNMTTATVPLSWLRWQTGIILEYTNGTLPPTAVDLTNQSVHTVFGESLQTAISTLGPGQATYNLVGGTTPTSFDGLSTGVLKSGNVTLDFASSSMNLQLVLNHPVLQSSGLASGNADYNLVGNNIGVDSDGLFNAIGLNVTSNGCVGCSGSVNGLFSGDDATNGPLSAGMVYQIADGVEGITGAAGFERQ